MLAALRSALALETIELALEILRAKEEDRSLPEMEIYQKLVELQELIRKEGR